MNKIEYLSALKDALKDIDESVMKEIVSDYEEHFQVGIENGKTEEQICEDLGEIEDLVKEIKEVYNTDSEEDKKSDDNQQNSENKKSKEWSFNIPNIDSEKIGSAINSALDSAGEAISKIDVIEIGHTLKNTLGQATSSISNFTDNYLKNHGTNPFDFHHRNAEGYKENVSKSYEACKESEESDCSPTGTEDTDVKTEEVTKTSDEDGKAENSENENAGLNLIIDGVCADIIITESSNDKLNISYENNGNERQKQMYEFYSYKEENTVYAGIRRVGKAVFSANLNLYSINIHVEIPEHMTNVNIKTASGDIKILNVKADRIIASAASGDVCISQVFTTDLRIKSSSGNISIEDINSIRVSAGTLSGDVDANNIDAKFLSMKSSSGDVQAKNIKADIIDNSSLSGDVDMNHLKVGECKIRSTSGDIAIDEIQMNNADISSISGKIKTSQITGDGLRATSISGNVLMDVNVKRCHASSKSGNVEVKCTGDITLESSSTSGNVNIILKNYGNGYVVNSRTTSGELYINYDNLRQRNLRTGTYTYGNQGSELNISSVSGDIHVTD